MYELKLYNEWENKLPKRQVNEITKLISTARARDLDNATLYQSESEVLNGRQSKS